MQSTRRASWARSIELPVAARSGNHPLPLARTRPSFWSSPQLAILKSVSARNERRGGERAPIQLKVEYQQLNSFFADYTKNISRGGTFIRTDKPLPVGTDFVFQLGIPSLSEPLVLAGKVQWIITSEQADAEQEPGMGIGFIFESEAERERVQGSIEQLMIEQLGPVLYERLLGHRKH
jgi:type IV pilus assembly protein PilZ